MRGGARRSLSDTSARPLGRSTRLRRRATSPRRTTGPASSTVWPATDPALERCQLLNELVDGNERRTPRQAHEGHLHRRPWLTAACDIVVGAREANVQTRQVLGARLVGQRQQLFELGIGQLDVPGWVLADIGNDQVAQIGEKVPRHVAKIEPLFCQLGDHVETATRIARDHRRAHLMQYAARGHAQDTRYAGSREPLARTTDPGDHLIEEAHRITHAARGFASHDAHSFVVSLDRFGGKHLAKAHSNRLGTDQLEVVALAATENGDGYLVNFRRRKDELHMRRRLFQSLQEGIPGRLRQHVHFVDDVDLEAVACGPVRQAFLEATHFVHARIAGAIDLLHVNVRAFTDLSTGVTDLTRCRRWPLLAVQRFRQDPRAGRLPDTTHTREQERVRDAVVGDRIRERAGDVLLPDEIVE